MELISSVSETASTTINGGGCDDEKRNCPLYLETAPEA
jgi:hypothetical protein